MSSKLVAEEGSLKGLVLSLENGEEWVIGRDPDECQLLLEDPVVSRKHLICRKMPEGITVENLSETNPVEINGEELVESRLLKQGDSVKIGEGLYRYYEEEGAKIMDEIVDDEEKMDEIADDEEITHASIYEESSEEDKGVLAEIDFDLREAGRWLLKVIGGPNNGAEFSMHAGESYVIGSDPKSADVTFHDTSVSRQHARITVNPNETLTIEDLSSRNGTLVDGKKIDAPEILESNAMVTIGTTSFVIFDREGEMQTIISPLLPSIVKALQEDKEEPKEESPVEIAPQAPEVIGPSAEEKAYNAVGAFIMIGIITGLFIIVGVGTTTLFRSEPVDITKHIDAQQELQVALSPFESVKYNYNDKTGTLFLVGHVLTTTDKNQLLYNLQGLTFLRSVDDKGIVIDELVWREINSVIARRSAWKGINVHSPKPGVFVISGYLQSRNQAETLSEYITANFPYTNNLEWRITVEEDVVSQIEIDLDNSGIRSLNVAMVNGEITLSGGVEQEKFDTLKTLITTFKKIPGVRNVRSYVSAVAPEQTMVNISDKYQVTGSSHQSGSNLNVVINGRILTKGDSLDGMTVTSIRPSTIFLEKSGIRYRIDYNQ